MFCSDCGAAQAASARFCARCGHRLLQPGTASADTQAIPPAAAPRFCRACSAELGSGEVYCSECGQRAGNPPAGRGAPTVTQAPVPAAESPTASIAGPQTSAATTIPRVSAPPMSQEPYRPRVAADPPVASFGARLGARFLDGLVMLGVVAVAALVAIVVGRLVLDSAGALAALILVALVYAAVVFAITAIIRVGGEGNRPGQTLGKAAFGIRVIRDTDASRAGYGPAFGRFFINLVPVLGLLSCLSMLWTPDKRCWHDSWTGTRVEKSPVPKRARGNRWDPAILATCLALVVSLGTVGLSGYLARNSTYPIATDTSGYASGNGGYYSGDSGGGYSTGNGDSGGYDSSGNGSSYGSGGAETGYGAGQAAEYCLADATPELYATTVNSILAICDTGSGLVYHGEADGQGITLPATKAADGYRAVNGGSTATFYDITPDHLKIWTKNKVLIDEPITEWEERGQ